MIPFLQLPRVHFEFGAVAALAEELTILGVTRPLFVTDRNLVLCGVFTTVVKALPDGASFALSDDIPENPTIAGVERALAVYRAENCDGVVALGGGSVIDSAKAVSVLAHHAEPLAHYLGHPERITQRVAPLIAIPTTAGTGSEASRGAGIHPDAQSRAKSLGSAHIVPKVAICDPDLTMTLPARLTAGTGMDALSHCIEGYLAKTHNPAADAVALDGVRRVATHIERAVADGSDRDARRHLMMAALEGGMTLSSKGAGPAHAIANTVGDRGFHHGTLVTIALPAVLRLLEPHAADKMKLLAEAMGAKPGRTAADAIEAMNAKLGLPANLRALGYPAADLDEMAADCANSQFNARSVHKPTPADFRAMIGDLLG
jgi:4-hydroxybutyrate dehydrogenase